ncbi:MAG: Ig-like domain-containing protein [Armatimonadetes bacterium]|nr:Ig-like domain-containing protein [Armatimonadota bacterium]
MKSALQCSLALLIGLSFLLVALPVYATPSVSVSAAESVLWANGPAAQSTLITATVKDGTTPLVDVTVNLITTLGTLSSSSGQTDSSGKVTATLSTNGSGGTATVTASTTINNQLYSNQTTVKFTLGSWDGTFGGSGTGSITWSGWSGSINDAQINGIDVISGQQVNISDATSMSLWVNMSGGLAVQANGSAQVGFAVDYSWVGQGNNTLNPPLTKVKVRYLYTHNRPCELRASPGMNPQGDARAQSSTQGSDMDSADVYRLSIPSAGSYGQPTAFGNPGPDPRVQSEWIYPENGTVSRTYTGNTWIAPYINTIRCPLVTDDSKASIVGGFSFEG